MGADARGGGTEVGENVFTTLSTSQQECQCSPESREMVNSTIFIYDRNVSGISINIITNKIL